MSNFIHLKWILQCKLCKKWRSHSIWTVSQLMPSLLCLYVDVHSVYLCIELQWLHLCAFHPLTLTGSMIVLPLYEHKRHTHTRVQSQTKQSAAMKRWADDELVPNRQHCHTWTGISWKEKKGALDVVPTALVNHNGVHSISRCLSPQGGLTSGRLKKPID